MDYDHGDAALWIQTLQREKDLVIHADWRCGLTTFAATETSPLCLFMCVWLFQQTKKAKS